MLDLQTLIYEQVEEGVVCLTLNQPEKLNAMSAAMLNEWDTALTAFQEDPGASVLIVRGNGRAFSAGYAVRGAAQPESNASGPPTQVPSPIHRDRTGLQKMVQRWQRLWSLPKPTVAEVHGYCLAGATELVGHCDIVFASEDAQFGHPAGRAQGVLTTLSMWPMLMGPRKAKEYLFAGDLMGAKEALGWHLVNRVYPLSQLHTETLAYARRVAKVPLELLALHKAAVNRFLEVTGFRAIEQSAADLDCIAHQTEAAKEFRKKVREKGLKVALSDRDTPFRTSSPRA